ncbi:4Fe-4S ferredoxin iron-sulfur binding domain-containing protein [Melioribacter roseus P3M-2]|jgi:NAD-dependent dihydropyrimidine dehydrogenase PreA subunit|uniref:4Fe-4S ferredoxin iron-sulfur binding domain-containing protein n=1 Tax=Melioribacter roseus (strain DSM 23840 / JCM 17771 / VKM B-2668 / P3M-2) TaxID=1191523 RepID=I6ZZB5_MELRP|nr:4Fe-4S binding protein [Melioribacter roseus]AFN74348.1 4Fe-4S ferredoxin iron-sulfur binding domain-containing protein [Melioribacter roseus P3M-2]
MTREIITIDEELCDGCGQCVPECREGALQIINGKARLISDLFCDGLGACIGNCPTGALKIEKREAEPYDEKKVMEYIVKGGSEVIEAHLRHLKEHNQLDYLTIAVEYLTENGIPIPNISSENKNGDSEQMEFVQWPIQLHLISPLAPHFYEADLLIAADCCGFVSPEFRSEFLPNKRLAIACPKLDTNKQIYFEKLITMIDRSLIKSITVLIMEVPCCGGLLKLAEQAIELSSRRIPLEAVVIGIDGKILDKMKVIGGEEL